MFLTGELIFQAAENSVCKLAEGDFAKNILVVALAEPQTVENRAFITKVLSAANLDLLKDTFFVEISGSTALNCFNDLPERPKFILVFGLPPKQVGLQAAVQAYQPLQLQNTTWVFADALSILEPNRDKKGQLWTILKSLFL
jgi:hypothetical protein